MGEPVHILQQNVQALERMTTVDGRVVQAMPLVLQQNPDRRIPWAVLGDKERFNIHRPLQTVGDGAVLTEVFSAFLLTRRISLEGDDTPRFRTGKLSDYSSLKLGNIEQAESEAREVLQEMDSLGAGLSITRAEFLLVCVPPSGVRECLKPGDEYVLHITPPEQWPDPLYRFRIHRSNPLLSITAGMLILSGFLYWSTG
jgi:hypothetical protein